MMTQEQTTPQEQQETPGFICNILYDAQAGQGTVLTARSNIPRPGEDESAIRALAEAIQAAVPVRVCGIGLNENLVLLHEDRPLPTLDNDQVEVGTVIRITCPDAPSVHVVMPGISPSALSAEASGAVAKALATAAGSAAGPSVTKISPVRKGVLSESKNDAINKTLRASARRGETPETDQNLRIDEILLEKIKGAGLWLGKRGRPRKPVEPAHPAAAAAAAAPIQS